jgi:adenylate cyclase class 2
LRVVGGRGTVTLKEKVVSAVRAKVRTETETAVEAPDAMRAVFARVGLARVYRYQKYRSYHAWTDPQNGRQLMISLDHTPIGVFLELEGDADSIVRAAAAMGFSPADHILDDYLTMHKAWLAQRGAPFGDMIFEDVVEDGRQGG